MVYYMIKQLTLEDLFFLYPIPCNLSNRITISIIYPKLHGHNHCILPNKLRDFAADYPILNDVTIPQSLLLPLICFHISLVVKS